MEWLRTKLESVESKKFLAVKNETKWGPYSLKIFGLLEERCDFLIGEALNKNVVQVF